MKMPSLPTAFGIVVGLFVSGGAVNAADQSVDVNQTAETHSHKVLRKQLSVRKFEPPQIPPTPPGVPIPYPNTEVPDDSNKIK